MIYFFYGNNRYLLRKEMSKWRDAFTQKFWEENVIYISSLQDVSTDFIQESLLGRSIFSQKRLIIIDGFPFSGEKEFSGAAEKQDYILSLIDKIPEETLVLFVSHAPDKRKSAFKTIQKIAEEKEFSLTWENQVLEILRKKYPDISDISALEKIVFLKGWKLEKSIWEIEKLRILTPNFTKKYVEEHTRPEFEESIFVFIDTLLLKNQKKIFWELENLLHHSNFYAIYQSIIANIRVFLYIELLKKQKKSPREIWDILKLWNRIFLIHKKHKTSFHEIQKLYENLLLLDKNMKSGKLISSDEKYLEGELKNIFLNFLA